MSTPRSSVRRAGTNGRGRSAIAGLCLAVLIAGAVAAPPANTAAETSAQAEQPAQRPAASFAETQFSVPYYGRVWTNHRYDIVDSSVSTATQGANYIGQVAVVGRDGAPLNAKYAVEGQSDTSEYQSCHPTRGCVDVNVRTTPAGLLYLHADRHEEDRVYFTHHGGFVPRAVELSASDKGSDLKVYREVEVEPPAAAAEAGCEDYGGDTPEAFTCLFLRELLPAGQPVAPEDEAALRAKLPKLVQDHANYSLAFAEEFNGTPPAADANGCRDGLSTLDADVWNYINACENVDSRGEPCGNVGGGGFTMAAAGTCKPRGVAGPFLSMLLDTGGHMHAKYGYIEMQYTFNIDQWVGVYHNYATLFNLRAARLRDHRAKYGVEVQTWEDQLKHSGVEIDIFENPGLFDVAHQYANWAARDHPEVLRPLQTQVWTDYCQLNGGQGIVLNPNAKHNRCQRTDTFTVTRGLEWTPRGYRTFIWVHGLQDGLTLVPEEKIGLTQDVGNNQQRKITNQRDRRKYFEELVPGDPSTLIQKAGVAHVPLPLNLNTWSFMVDRHPYIKRRLTFDYVRIWKPANNYTDMEPVYQ